MPALLILPSVLFYPGPLPLPAKLSRWDLFSLPKVGAYFVSS